MLLPLLKVDFNPVEEFTGFVHNPYVKLPLGLDINKAVVYMWLAAALAMGLTLLVVRRGLKVRPDGKQTAVEAIYDLCQEQVAKGGQPTPKKAPAKKPAAQTPSTKNAAPAKAAAKKTPKAK